VRAARGPATIAPPIKPMKSRRLMAFPERHAGSSDCELLCRGHFKIEMGFA